MVEGQARPVAGARVFLVDAATGLELPATDLFGGQQGQRTSSQGFYRFDVRNSALPGEFRIRIEPPSPAFLFPSSRRPPVGISADDPWGAAAVTGPGGKVVPSDFPDLNADTSYFLRFALEAGQNPVTNNHIPLESLSERLVLSQTVSRTTAQRGDVLDYTLTLINPTDAEVAIDPGSGTGGVVVVNDFPEGIRWVEGSAFRRIGVDGVVQSEGPAAVRSYTGRRLTFQSFTLGPRSEVTYRYQALVSVRARGPQTHRARATLDNVLISNEARVTVEVQADTTLDEGTVVGRVFCDQGDGRWDDGDLGVPGVRLFLDTGFWVETDLAGKFHFRGVAPGRRLLKLDATTLPAASQTISDIARDIYLSRGLLAPVYFAVRCGWKQVHTEMAPAPPPSSTTTVPVSIDATLSVVSVDGTPRALPWVDAVLQPAGEAPDFDTGYGINLTRAVPVVWHIQRPLGHNVERWNIAVFKADGEEVWRIEGAGEPPSRIPWELTVESMPLQPGVEHVYRIALQTSVGDMGEGRYRRVVFRKGSSGEELPNGVVEAPIPTALWRGALFDPNTDRPRDALLAEIEGLVQSLKDEGLKATVRIEVHTASGPNRNARLLLSQRRAVVIAEMVTASGIAANRVTALGLGDSQPLMPNTTRRGRALNERVTIFQESIEAATEALPPVEYPGWLVVGNEVLELGTEPLKVGLQSDPTVSGVLEYREPNGRRVVADLRLPVEVESTAPQEPVEIQVVGSLSEGTVTVGDDTLALPLLTAQCETENGQRTADNSRLDTPVRFVVNADVPLAEWRIEIRNRGNIVLTELRGSGEPPDAIWWNGENQDGVFVASEEAYQARCLLTDGLGNRVVSEPQVFKLDGAFRGWQEEATEIAFPPGGLDPAVSALLQRAISDLQLHPTSRVEVEVHDHDRGGPIRARRRTERVANRMAERLRRQGIASDRVTAVGRGADVPRMAGSSRRARSMNRRVVMRVVASEEEPSTEDVESERAVGLAKVFLGETELIVEDGDRFKGSILTDVGASMALQLQTAPGREVVYHLTSFGTQPLAFGREPLPQQGVPESSLSLGSNPTSLTASEPDVLNASSLPAFEILADAEVDAVAGFQPDLPPRSPSGIAAEAPVGLTSAVYLPAEGAKLPGERLTVLGSTDPRNKVSVNGRSVSVDSTGRFAQPLELPSGQASVDITIESPDGQKAQLLRSVEVPEAEWFALGLANGLLGWGQAPDGVTDDTRLDFGSEGYLHGRLAAYFRGRLDAQKLWRGSPFDVFRLDAYIETGRRGEADPALDLFNPDRYFPVFGDASEDVQGVSSRLRFPSNNGQWFAELKADQSKLLAGNFKTSLTSGSLIRYERNHYGALLDVDHEFWEGHRSELKGFVGYAEEGVLHRQLTLQGTGTALYLLRDGDILEGSEVVRLVVRDQVTGVRLYDVDQVRNADYTVDYREGRLIFRQPIGATFTSPWLLNPNGVRPLEGHAIFIEVEYDFRTGGSLEGADAWGGQLRHHWGDWLSLGGTVLSERRSDMQGTRYLLTGGDAKLRLLEQTELELEFGFSRARDGEHLASFDGGQSFGTLGTPFGRASGERRNAGVIEGWAGRLRLGGDALELFGKQGLPYAVYAQHQAPGFFAGGAVVEQGQTAVGGQLRWLVTERDTVRFRHDGTWSRIYLEQGQPRVVRQIGRLAYEHRRKTWSVGTELGGRWLQDRARRRASGGAAVFGEYRLSEALVLLGEQEVQGLGSGFDVDTLWQRFETRLGARYRLGEKLWLQASESIAWDGTNSTELGLRSELDDGFNVYVSERVQGGGPGLVATTVVGGESTTPYGSRSYAEYQMDALASGRRGRAVLGMDNRWTVAPDLDLHLSYERSQRLGRSPRTLVDAGSPLTTPGVAGVGSGVRLRDRQFAAPGFSSASVFPAGVASRDAFAVGVEWRARADTRASARAEMRYDQGDPITEVPDRFVVFGALAAQWRLDRMLIALGRAQASTARNVDIDLTEGQFLDVSLGLALRPESTHDYGGLFKWTHRVSRRAVAAALNRYTVEVIDVVSLEPFIELGWGVQWVGKAALKMAQIDDPDFPTSRSITVLAISRLNYHLTSVVDAAVEYRWLGNVLAEQTEHGPLVEVAWSPVRHVALGVGYNFTRFTDDLLVEDTGNHHGVFLRVTGRY